MSGINDKWNNTGNNGLLGKVISLAKHLTNSLKNAFGIHSPSKEWGEIGNLLDLGLIQGIESKEQKVLNTISKLSSGMNDTLQDGMSSDLQLPNIVQGKVIPSNMSYQLHASSSNSDIRGMIREELSRLNLSMPEVVRVEMPDGRVLAETVWVEEEREYKQTGRRYGYV